MLTIHFSELRSPQVAQAAQSGAVLVLPVGQTEEHGPHLPIHTDFLIAQRVTEEAVRRLDGEPPAFVLDPIAYGYSQNVLRRWPGTFRLPQETVIDTLTHICTSLADMGLRKVVLVNAHGNHDGVARVAARKVADACGAGPGIIVPYAFCADILQEHGKAGPGGSCHAGEFETSVMLHLAPHLVDMSVAPPQDAIRSASPYSSSQAFVSTWTRQRSESGAYGDPTEAAAELGVRLFDRMVDETVRFVRYYHGLEQV